MASGADPNLRDRRKSSPLHRAAEAGHHGVLGILLLKKGADMNATNDLQKTPLHLAASKGHTLCISELLLGNADKDVVDAVRVLLEAGADVDAKTTDDVCETPLHVAVCRRIASIGTIRALLEGGANVNVRDGDELTPLHVACM
ncbi:unnamed protein product, partial [Ectocarpus sp. 8 AP-2014]